ncbi:Rhomboid-like protease 1 [Durusdinium trenchii]|uniref:Rhomboid-like protease n=1 Tax=Durusdinium trenchii TaxID=1381693 RepID=A0ABP0QBU7_9DINO
MGPVHSAYNYVFPPDPVEIYNPGLEDRISHANDAVESAFQDMSQTFAQMKSVMQKTQTDWEKYSTPLSNSCQDIRKELVRLAHGSPQCLDAQERILPLLFKKRAKTGEEIKGCARGDLPFAMVPSTCQCIAGNEAKGCDAEVDSDHVLQCTHLRRRILPALQLQQLYEEMRDASNFSRWVTVCWRVAQGDGDCSISKGPDLASCDSSDGVSKDEVFFQLRMGFGMERQFGREKMMMIYFACGLFGNLMSVAVDPYKLAVGASTAGFGLIGVWLAEILLSWEILGPARERTVIWIVFMMISVTTMSSMTPNMDIFGHLGGALGGFLLALVISDMKETDRPEWYHQVRAAAALALLLCLSGGLIKAFEINPKDPIPDCQIFKSLSHVMDAAAKTMSAHVTAVQ